MYQRLRRQLCPDLGIDLGTANTVAGAVGAGIVFSEPSVVAVRHGTRQVLGRGTAVGKLARQMLGRTPDGVTAVRPLRAGVVTDFELAEALLRYFLQKAGRQGLGLRPRVILSVPAGVTQVERRAVFNAAERAGAGQVFLIDAARAASIGAGLPIAEPIASMICDLGGGTTEIAVLCLGDIVSGRSLRLGGDDFDEAIAESLRQNFALKIGPHTAERLKIELGSAAPLDEELTLEVGGLDAVSGAPRKAVITSEDVREAVAGLLGRIVTGLRAVIEGCPPELVADLADQGVLLCGGGSQLRQLDRFLTEQLGLPVRQAAEPQRTVAQGVLICTEHFADWRGCLDAGDRAA